MKTKYLLISFLLLLLSAGAFAQGENNVWCFGRNLGLDFNTPGGPSFFKSNMIGFEGCASVSDKSGNLLFYCDGSKVYDRMHVVMPNGIGILGDISTTQGVAIARFPTEDSLFYLFTLTDQTTKAYLRYSIIDMRLNGGLGDVEVAFKNIYIREQLSEHMIIAGNCEKQWLLVHSRDSSKFYAYQITGSKTIASPIVSNTGSTGIVNYRLGEMKISPDLKTLAMATFRFQYGLDLYDFNNISGIVSGYRVLDSNLNKGAYGVAFSPDNSKLYVGTYSIFPGSSGGLFQYDLSAGSYATITASKYKILDSVVPGLRLGPDKMIYVIDKLVPTNFSRIREPNRPGILCNFQSNFLPSSFSNTFQCLILGNHFVSSFTDTAFTKTVYSLCEGSTVKLKPFGSKEYYWSDADTASSKIVGSKNKVYLCWSRTPCSIKIDTFEIREIPKSFESNRRDLELCEKSLITLSGKTGSDSIKWSDGNTFPEKTITTDISNLWVQSFKGCALTVDTFNINFKPLSVLNITKDTSICFKSSVKIAAPGTFQTYLWNGGNTGFDTTLYTDGRVIVVAKDTIHCTILKQDYTVSFVNFSSNIPDTSTCNEDTLILDATIPNPEARYRWNVGDTTAKLKVTSGSRYVFITLNGCTLTDTVNVKRFPMKVNIGEDTSFCVGKKTTLSADVDNVSYRWSTGETTQSIEVSESGNYGVTIFKDACSGKDEIDIRFVNCENCVAFPTGFTPNHDGINDYFKPILNCPPRGYQLKILNRWGQEVYTSTNPNDKWDGTSQGTPLDGGVYFFMLKVKFEAQDDEEKMFKGALTLLR